MTLILASQSASRREMLRAAGVSFDVMAPDGDEETAKQRLRAQNLGAGELAGALAQFKAHDLSVRFPDDLILGCDQTLECEDGSMVDKAIDQYDAAQILRKLSASSHYLHSAAVILQGGAPVWQHMETVKMTMRPLSDAFIAAYLDEEWAQCRWCVGCYRIEGPGAQLFRAIEGSHFAIQGLPLLPLLDFLRERGVLAS
ncbi:MAG: nucleoside triphosphate pyrophosphatase [Sphingobium sp.]